MQSVRRSAEHSVGHSVGAALAEIAATAPGPATVAFFDLDGTLVAGFTATVHAGHRMRHRQAGVGEVLGVLEAAVRYRLGRMPFERLIVRAAGYLRGQPLADLDGLGQELFDRRIAERVFADMRAVVGAHQDRGHAVVLISSALTIHADPVARHLGIPVVVCNHFEVDAAGRLTGGITAPIVWHTAKAAALRGWAAARGVDLQRCFFYSDGDEDLPSMRAVGRPRPVNPRRRLAVAAAAAGWPVLRVRLAPRAAGDRPR